MGAPGLSGGSTLDFHPLSHTDCTRTALLPHGHCSTRTTKDKIGAGSCSAPSWSHPQHWGGGDNRDTQGPKLTLELILSLDIKETKTERNKGKSYIDPSPTPQPRARSKEQPQNQKQKGPKEEGRSRSLTAWSVGWGGVGMEVQASKRGRGSSLSGERFVQSSRSVGSASRPVALPALCPAIPLSVRPPVPGARENLLGFVGFVVWLPLPSGFSWLHFSLSLSLLLSF